MSRRSGAFNAVTLEAFRAAALQYVLRGGGICPDKYNTVCESFDRIAQDQIGISEEPLRAMVAVHVSDARQVDDIVSEAMNIGYNLSEVGFAFGVQVGLIIAGGAR